MMRVRSEMSLTGFRMLTVTVRRYHVRVWLKRFSLGYSFADYGPRCFGFAWFGCMIFTIGSKP